MKLILNINLYPGTFSVEYRRDKDLKMSAECLENEKNATKIIYCVVCECWQTKEAVFIEGSAYITGLFMCA